MPQKSWLEKLNDSKDLPKIVTMEKAILGAKVGDRLLIAPPLAYDKIMKKVKEGEIISTTHIRQKLAKMYKADLTCPLTAGIFINIVAHAAEEQHYLGKRNTTPWWRTVKAKGELNSKFPGGLEEQSRRLKSEGHPIEVRGDRMFVVLNYA